MWLSVQYVDNLIGAQTRAAVAPTDPVFRQFEETARAKVIAVLQHAGYASPGTSLPTSGDAAAFLRMLCAAQWCREAFGNRKGISFPPSITDAFELLNAVYDRRIPVPGMHPSSADGYGGSRFSSRRDRPQVFSRRQLRGF